MSSARDRRHRTRRHALLALAGAVTAGWLAACSSGSPAGSVGTAGTANPTRSSGVASSSSTSSPTAPPTTPPTADAPSARDLLATARTATAAARSGRVRGHVTDQGETYVIDSASTADGKDATGTFSYPAKAATVRYIVSRGGAYLSGDAGFWASAGAPADRAASLGASGKWVKTSASAIAELTDSSSFSTLVRSLFTQTGSVSALTQRVDSTLVGTIPCWAMSDRFSGSDATFYFAKATGLPARITATDQGAPQQLDFDEWDTVPAARAPAASEIIAEG